MHEERPKEVVVDDRMQRGYTYWLTEPEGEHFDAPRGAGRCCTGPTGAAAARRSGLARS